MKTHFVQKNNVEATQLDNEWIILNTDHCTVTKLNDIGGYCWSLLSQEQTIESLLHAVTAEFELGPSYETAQEDIKAFISELIQFGLVQNVN